MCIPTYRNVLFSSKKTQNIVIKTDYVWVTAVPVIALITERKFPITISVQVLYFRLKVKCQFSTS